MFSVSSVLNAFAVCGLKAQHGGHRDLGDPGKYFFMVRLFQKVRVKKEKQPWQSQRCFPGCVLEVVCLVRR
jgi:hypothetical protein